MDKPVTLARRIPSFWHIVEQIRDDVKTSLTDYPEEIRDAGVMTASELVENAVKYSSHTRNGDDIGFDLSADGKAIAIRVTNAIGCTEDYEALAACIRRVTSAPDVKALYINQLTRLMETPCTARTGLGVYRIAYEGCFTLSCHINEELVHIKALRNL